jgi:hypothetical protein
MSPRPRETEEASTENARLLFFGTIIILKNAVFVLPVHPDASVDRAHKPDVSHHAVPISPIVMFGVR